MRRTPARVIDDSGRCRPVAVVPELESRIQQELRAARRRRWWRRRGRAKDRIEHAIRRSRSRAIHNPARRVVDQRAGNVRGSGARVIGEVERRDAGGVRRGHRSSADGVRSGIARIPVRGDVHARAEDVDARAVVRKRRARVGAVSGGDGDCRGDARRRCGAGVGVAVAGCDAERHAGVDRAVHCVVERL